MFTLYFRIVAVFVNIFVVCAFLIIRLDGFCHAASANTNTLKAASKSLKRFKTKCASLNFYVLFSACARFKSGFINDLN